MAELLKCTEHGAPRCEGCNRVRTEEILGWGWSGRSRKFVRVMGDHVVLAIWCPVCIATNRDYVAFRNPSETELRILFDVAVKKDMEEADVKVGGNK